MIARLILYAIAANDYPLRPMIHAGNPSSPDPASALSAAEPGSRSFPESNDLPGDDYLLPRRLRAMRGAAGLAAYLLYYIGTA